MGVVGGGGERDTRSRHDQLTRVLNTPPIFPLHTAAEMGVTFAGDDSLETWVKLEEPMIANPPPSMPLVGWRDPYIFETMTSDNKHEWGMLLGSGIKGKGGSVMIYRSKSLRSGVFFPPPVSLEAPRGTQAWGGLVSCTLFLDLSSLPRTAIDGIRITGDGRLRLGANVRKW